ncbi:MAG TPA: hypothetical protein VKQ10_00745 [Spirochaetota bacterium]|nr:hypothetical protein [Spirochaetota bacterium]
MNGDVLIQNIINLFVIAIILEAAVMAVFSMSALRDASSSRPIEATRDAIIIVIAFFLCYKVNALQIFRGTGLRFPDILDVVISALVLTRMTNFVRGFMSRFRQE